MDDTTSNILTDSKNEWSILLMNYVTPHIMDGFRSIFNESVQLCDKNEEPDKYLMTFQNLLTRIPKWNQQTIDLEKERIVKLCNCAYLEDLLVCVHIIQMKILSCVRVGTENKKLNIDIPDFGLFIHQVYTNVARKLYSSIYLFELEVSGLERQKRTREFELMVQICIMNTVRDKIPVEALLRQYIDESTEYIVKEPETKPEVKIEPKPEVKQEPMPEPNPEPKPEPKLEVKLEVVPETDLFGIPDIETPTETKTETKSTEEPKPKLSFNPEVETFNLPPLEVLEEDFKIGEDVPLNTMCFDEMDKDTIDLGIVEL
jgi:hypothetical protein